MENNLAKVESQIDSLEQRMSQEYKQRDVYWAKVEEKTEDLLNTSDEEIVSKSKGLFDWFTDLMDIYSAVRQRLRLTSSKLPSLGFYLLKQRE